MVHYKEFCSWTLEFIKFNEFILLDQSSSFVITQKADTGKAKKSYIKPR